MLSSDGNGQQMLDDDRDSKLHVHVQFNKALLNTIDALIMVLDLDGRIVLFNDNCSKATGFSSSDVCGSFIWDKLIPEGEKNGVKERFTNISASGSTDHYRNNWLTKDGDMRLIDWYNNVLCNEDGEVRYILATGVDITDKVKTEEALMENEERFRAISESSPMGMFQTDKDGAVTYLNDRWCEITGMQRDDAMGFGWITAIHPDDKAQCTEDWKRCIDEKKGYSGEFRFCTPSGAVRWVLTQTSPIVSSNGEVTGHVGVNEDITERKKAHDELKLYSTKLQDMVKERTLQMRQERDKTRELLEGRTKLINQLSHDLRTPLTPLNIFIPLLAEQVSDPELDDSFSIVTRNLKYITDLVTNTLNLARLESGTISYKFEDIDLKALVDEVLEDNLIQLNRDGIDMVNNVPPDSIINADKLRIREVLNNLVINAIKYSGGGSRITVDLESTDGGSLIIVSDDGIGISSEFLDDIFKEYHRVDDSRHEHSLGLGLAIARLIVNGHGGHIWAESAGPGKGSTIKVFLPSGY